MSVNDAVPSHVSPDLVVDFDFLHPAGFDEDPFLALKRLHNGPDIFWTPHNKGHWVATRGEDIRHILSDHDHFSSQSAFIPKSARPPAIPLEIDPPDHMAYRRLLAPAFLPKAISTWSSEARELAISLIEGFRPKGECEFMADFALQVPIIVFLKMCGLPLEHREMLLEWTAAFVRPGNAEIKEETERQRALYIHNLIVERRANPGEDLISRAVNADIGGRKLNDQEAYGLIRGLLGGGLDTVASTMGWIARFLAENPEHRRQLIDDPELIPNAVEELLRRFSVPNIARVVVKDMVYKGVAMKEGEQIFLSACLHGLDTESFENPLEVNFRRSDARTHSTFGQGIHRCPGATLASSELRIFLEEWLKRIPDFRIKPGAAVRTGTGIVHGVLSLPLAWDV